MRRLILTVIVGLFWAIPAWAAPEAVKVEIVFFTFTNTHLNSEYFDIQDDDHPATGPAIELSGQAQDRFHLLPASQYSLAGIEKRLKAETGYHPLYHLAWRQPVLDQKAAKAVRIRAGRDYTDRFRQSPANAAGKETKATGGSARLQELTGSVELVYSQNFYLKIDLRLREPYTPRTADSGGLAGGARLGSYPLKTARKLKTGELYYIDHPRYGIIVEVTPL